MTLPILQASLQQHPLDPISWRGHRDQKGRRLATALLQLGARAPKQGTTSLLMDIAQLESGQLSHTTNLSLTIENDVLELRYHTVYCFDFYRARRTYDAHHPGLLGRLLRDLRDATDDLVTWFTPEDAAEALDMNEEMIDDEVLSRAPEFVHKLPYGQQERYLRGVRRSVARHLRAQGDIPPGPLDKHQLGATLALPKLYLPQGELGDQVSTLPRTLRVGALACMDVTKNLRRTRQALHLEACALTCFPEEQDDLAHMTYPAFLITAGVEGSGRTDLTHELMEEAWQMAAQYGNLPATLRLPYRTPLERKLAARALLATCRALRGVRLALTALGGDDSDL